MSLKKGKRGKVVSISGAPGPSPASVAADFLRDQPNVRGVVVVAFFEGGKDAFSAFGDVSRKDVAFMGSVLTAEAIGLDTGD